MLVDDFAEVHPVELVAGEDQDEIMGMGVEVLKIAPHGIGCPLIPRGAEVGLFGGKQVDEPGAKRIEMKTFVDVPVQRSRQELGQQVDAIVAGI